MIATKPKLEPISAAQPAAPNSPALPGSYTHKQVLVIYSGLMLGMLLAALDQTVVATALPTIVGDLGGLNHLSWVVTAYLLTSTASTLLYGKIGDLFGRKRIFQAAIVIFVFGSVLSGLSQNMFELIAFRALQGVGAGGLMSLAMAIIGDVVSPRERGRYQGYTGAVFGLSSIAGPLLGGFFVDTLSWRWVFYINVPVGIAALIVSSVVLRETVRSLRHKIDYAGSALMVAGVTTLLLVTTWGGSEYAWTSPTILGLAAVAVACIVLFVVTELRVEEPILPLALFRGSIFTISNIGTFFLGISMFGSIVFLPMFLQLVNGASATNSGLLLMPLMMGMITASIISGRYISSTGRYKFFPIVGQSLMLVAFFLLSTMNSSTTTLQAGAYMVVLGVGMGMTMQVLVVAVQNAVDLRNLGTATSALQFFRSMGGALGVAVFGSILNNRLAYNLPRLLPAGALKGGFDPSLISQAPDKIAALPAPIRTAIIDSFSNSLHVVFVATIPMIAIALIASLFLEERPLRTTIQSDAEASSETFAVSAAI